MTFEEILEFRTKKDKYYASAASPFPEFHKPDFPGLRYYDFNPALSVQAKFQISSGFEHIAMETSGGVKKHFVKAGMLEFLLDGQTVQLAAYSNPEIEDSGLFVPFRDANSGHETYGGGRYLDTELDSDGTVKLDFNLAYNPYCAYSDGWTCPIPPLENRLKIPILAGEKNFGSHL